MTFDPLVGESLQQHSEIDSRLARQDIPDPCGGRCKHHVESLLLGPETRWVPMLQALTILDNKRCSEPPRQQGAHVRRRVVRAPGVPEKRLDRSDLRAVLDHQEQHGGHVEHILVHLGFTDEEEIVHELTTHFGFPYLPLSHYELDSRIVRLVPVEVARHYCLIPIDRIGNVLTIAMANPLNSEAIKDIQRLTDCSVLTMVSRVSEIREKIEECHSVYSGLLGDSAHQAGGEPHE